MADMQILGEEVTIYFHWADSVSMLGYPSVCVCLCLCVCATFFCCCNFFTFLLLSFIEDKIPITQSQKDSLGKSLKKKDIGLRFSGLCSEMIKNCHTEKSFFLSFALICMDAQRNLHGPMTEFAWTHNRICMDCTTKLAWTKKRNFSFWGQKIDIYIFIYSFCVAEP